MIIKFNNFTHGVHEIDFIETAEKLGLDEYFIDSVEVKCSMDKSQHQIVLFCKVKAVGVFECDRCTTEFEQDLENDFEVIYIFGDSDNDEEDIDIRFLSPEADKIDITEDVVEFCQLAIPFKKLCDEDCKGLCQKCGTNLNEKKCDCKDDVINPVWEPLMKLKDKLN